MQNLKITIIRALLYVLVVIILHIMFVYILGIKIEGWSHKILRDILKSYASPLFYY